MRPGAPNPGDYEIISDTQETDGDLRHLRGHVHMESIDKRFDADLVDYNDDTGDVEAWGNIRYENFLDGTKLFCDHLTYNVNTEGGLIISATVEGGRVTALLNSDRVALRRLIGKGPA